MKKNKSRDIRKSLETNDKLIKQRKNKREYFIEAIEKYGNISLSIVAIIISIISLLRNNETLLPKFSLEVLRLEENNAENLNRKFKIYNSGGQIVNPKISPVMQLELDCITYYYGIPKKESSVLVELTDYFSDEYFFDNSESAFVISETKANLVYDLMDNLNEIFEEKNIKIQMYSLRCYYKISYFDYKGDKKEKILIPMNNYDLILYDKSDRIRYCKDNELKEIKNVNMPNIEIPIEPKGSNYAVTINNSTNNGTTEWIDGTRKVDEYLSGYIVDYIKEYSTKLDVDRETGAFLLTGKKVSELIMSETNTVIGAKELEKHVNKKIVIMIITLFCILIFAVIFFVRYKNKKHGKTNKK